MSKNYNKTLNLPSTGFSMRANLKEKEPRIQKKWDEMNLYAQMLEKNETGEKYILHDGPPYANGHIHMGHALNRVLKDILVKFKLMQGYYAPFVPGWDCHGLPVEYELLKQMKNSPVKDKLLFRKKAARYALKFVKIQKKEFKRLGLSGDWENPYLTLDKSYEETIIDSFSRLYEKGYIYRELKPVHWCFSCRTALAEAEVEYADIKSPSISVKFRLLSEKPDFTADSDTVYALAWTTTPWTLPANTALCFHPDENYVFLREKEGSVIIVAEALSGRFENFQKLGVLKGSCFSGAAFEKPLSSGTSKGVNADFVSMQEGTGIVHIAPGHGEEDYAAGKEFDLDIISPVDERGCFTSDVEIEEIKGTHVFKSDPVIIKMLKQKGLLPECKETSHSYPHCWRCKSPVIFRATRQWFLDVDKAGLRDKILSHIKEVKWLPPSGEKRIRAMIENRPDWCLSRQRMWGVPIPVFYCRECSEVLASSESFGKVKEMIKEHGSDGWFRLSAQEILGKDIKCSCSSTSFRREEDILDVWFDSGVSSMAVLEKRPGHRFPADMYLEGSDQHRGWFQTSMIPSAAIKGSPPYRAVFTHGFIVDREGKKMSKSVGNVTSPQEVVDKYGADLLRLTVSTENYFKDVKISQKILSQTVTYYRRIRNTIRYILGNCSDFDSSRAAGYEQMTELDKFILHKFASSAGEVIENYKKNLFYKSTRELHEFCNGWLSSFYFNIIKDRLYVSHPDDKKRRSSQSALVAMGKILLKLIAPVLPHTAEEGWQKMKEEIPACSGMPESVFLSPAAEVPARWQNDELGRKWENLAGLREAVLKKIEEAKEQGLLKDPLESAVSLEVCGAGAEKFLSAKKDILKEVFIVSRLSLTAGEISAGGEAFMGGKVKISVNKAAGEKCPRCWLIEPNVEKEGKLEGLCRRCADVVSKILSEDNPENK